MMRVEICPKIGLMSGPPMTVETYQCLIRNEQGTPVCLVLAGTDGTVMVSRADDPDFAQQLLRYGIRNAPTIRDFRAS